MSWTVLGILFPILCECFIIAKYTLNGIFGDCTWWESLQRIVWQVLFLNTDSFHFQLYLCMYFCFKSILLLSAKQFLLYIIAVPNEWDENQMCYIKT